MTVPEDCTKIKITFTSKEGKKVLFGDNFNLRGSRTVAGEINMGSLQESKDKDAAGEFTGDDSITSVYDYVYYMLTHMFDENNVLGRSNTTWTEGNYSPFTTLQLLPVNGGYGFLANFSDRYATDKNGVPQAAPISYDTTTGIIRNTSTTDIPVKGELVIDSKTITLNGENAAASQSITLTVQAGGKIRLSCADPSGYILDDITIGENKIDLNKTSFEEGKFTYKDGSVVSYFGDAEGEDDADRNGDISSFQNGYIEFNNVSDTDQTITVTLNAKLWGSHNFEISSIGTQDWDEWGFFPLAQSLIGSDKVDTSTTAEWGQSTGSFLGDIGAQGVKPQHTNNYHYALTSEGTFVYHEDDNLYFDFTGDDDVYLFINGKLAMDIGGAHKVAHVRVNLNELDKDEFGLEEGEVCDFSFFYLERHTDYANIRILTNMRVTEGSAVTSKKAYVNGSEISSGGAVSEGSDITYALTMKNISEDDTHKMRYIHFVDPLLGVDIGGIQKDATGTNEDGYARDADGELVAKTIEDYQLGETDPRKLTVSIKWTDEEGITHNDSYNLGDTGCYGQGIREVTETMAKEKLKYLLDGVGSEPSYNEPGDTTGWEGEAVRASDGAKIYYNVTVDRGTVSEENDSNTPAFTNFYYNDNDIYVTFGVGEVSGTFDGENLISGNEILGAGVTIDSGRYEDGKVHTLVISDPWGRTVTIQFVVGDADTIALQAAEESNVILDGYPKGAEITVYGFTLKGENVQIGKYTDDKIVNTVYGDFVTTVSDGSTVTDVVKDADSYSHILNIVQPREYYAWANGEEQQLITMIPEGQVIYDGKTLSELKGDSTVEMTIEFYGSRYGSDKLANVTYDMDNNQAKYTPVDKIINIDGGYSTKDDTFYYEIKVIKKDENGNIVGVETVRAPILVHLYDLNDDIYVLDYGIPVEMNTPDQYGIFGNDNLRSSADTTVQSIKATTESKKYGDVNITAATIDENKKSDANVKYKPKKFMEGIDTFQYSVSVKESAEIPEDAITSENGVPNMTANVQVVPANIIYYEDNFSQSGTDADGTNGIIYSAKTEDGVKVETGGTTVDEQSNSLEGQYGYDSIYANGGSGFSNGSANNLENGSAAAFEFSGTGFDILSRTNTTTGTMLVTIYEVKEGVENPAKLINQNGVIKIENTKGNLVESIVVDTYYRDGDLYQIPVITWRNDDGVNKRYIVKISSWSRGGEGKTVFIDGIRIYNPVKGNEIAEEQYDNIGEKNAEIIELKNMIFGDGYKYDYDNPLNSTFVNEAKATLFRFPNEISGEENTAYFLTGNTVVESFGGIATPEVTKDMMDYAVQGPNNELYLNNDSGFGFYADVKDAQAKGTLQVGVKKVHKADGAFQLQYYNGTNWTAIAIETDRFAIDSATELYIRLDNILQYCPKTEDGKAKVMIRAAGGVEGQFLSITSVKVNNYELSPLDAQEFYVHKDNSKLAISNFTWIAGDLRDTNGDKSTVEGDYYSYTFTTVSAVEEDEVTLEDVASVVDDVEIEMDGEILKAVSKTFSEELNSDGITKKRTWKIKFKASASVSSFNIVAYNQGDDCYKTTVNARGGAQ